MKFETYTGITWSRLELRGVLEDEDSRVYFERLNKHLGLHPFHLTNLNTALNEILSSNLNSYDPELKGYLLAYKNPKVLTPLGEILYDTCFIHIDVEVDFYIFRPEVGCTLKGIVNKKGINHIGVLVHKAFNVSIPQPEGIENWIGDNLEIGQEIKLVITQLDNTSRLPFIRGVLNEDEYLQGCRLMDKSLETCNERIPVDNDNQDSQGYEDIATPIKSEKQPKCRTLFDDDSMDSEAERIAEKHEKVSVKEHSKKSKHLKEENVTTDEETKIESKKQLKKLKDATKESKHVNVTTELKQQQLTNAHTDSDVEVYGLKNNISKEHRVKQSAIISSVDNTTEEYEFKKPGKSNKKNSSTKLSDTDTKLSIKKIKLEKSFTDDSDATYNSESDTPRKKSKSKKQSTKRADVNSTDNEVPEACAKSTPKKHSKSSRKTVSENEDTCVNVKFENSVVANTTVTEPHETSGELEETPYRKQLKKYKLAMKLDFNDAAKKNDVTVMSSPQKRARKSSVRDSEFLLENVKIKTETLSSDTENERVGKEKASRPANSTMNSSCDGNEGEERRTKKAKKRTKKSMDEFIAVPDFKNVTIKQEKVDDDNVESTAKRIRVKKEPEADATASKRTHNDDAIGSQKSIKSKKLKASNKEPAELAVRIKTEHLPQKRSPRKSVSEYESDGKEEKKYSKSSPLKHSEARKSGLQFDLDNIGIKFEKDSSDS